MRPTFQTARRSLRKPACIPVWLRNEARGPIWEEETETHVVSRFGAGLHCRHSIVAESVVTIIRRDNGQRVFARVKYSRYSADGRREFGIEFIDKDNFWELDWNPGDAAQPQSVPCDDHYTPESGDQDTNGDASVTSAGTHRETLD